MLLASSGLCAKKNTSSLQRTLYGAHQDLLLNGLRKVSHEINALETSCFPFLFFFIQDGRILNPDKHIALQWNLGNLSIKEEEVK